MPRNKKRNWRDYKRLSILKKSQRCPDGKRPYIESHDFCQKCGRSLKFYTYETSQLCEICVRDESNWQKDIQLPGSGTSDWQYLQPGTDPATNSFEGFKMLSFEENDNNYSQDIVCPDMWQRNIHISDACKPSSSFNNYVNPQDFQYQSQSQRTSSSTSLNATHSALPLYYSESNYEFSNTPSTSFPIHQKRDQKRKREHEEMPSKKMKAMPSKNMKAMPSKNMKAMPYGSASQFCQYDQLSMNILSYFRSNVQTDWIFKKKMDLRCRLQEIIQREFSGCNIFVFGSSMTGFATKTSDVDMSLIFYNAKIVQNRVVRLLWELHSLFSRYNNFKKLQVIRAKVAILKFRDTLSGFEIDLNINNPTGIRNSQLLRSYARLDDRVRPLILAVKFWAREHKINDAKSGTLSSYSLGLMLIHYLQYGCNPPVLPSLQILQPDKYLPTSDVGSLELDEVLPTFISANSENVGQLFVGFLHYYSKQFNYEEKRISVRLGSLLPRVDKILDNEKILKHWIDIEEPFEQVNTARAVHNPKVAAYIKSVFDNSYNSVVQKGALGFI